IIEHSGFACRMGVAAVTHALALGAINDEAAERKVFECPPDTVIYPILQRIRAFEMCRIPIIRPYHPSFDVIDSGCFLQSADGNPSSRTVIEPVAERALSAGTNHVC